MKIDIFLNSRGTRRRFPEMDMMPLMLTALVLVILAWASIRFYNRTFIPITDLQGRKDFFLLIPTGAGFQTVLDSLSAKKCLTDKEKFTWLSRRKHYDARVLPGRYRIRDGMSNNALVNLLRGGLQEPVRLTIHNVRTPEELAGKLARRLEPDSGAFMRVFSDPAVLSGFGVKPSTLFVLFIPNTYDLYWNTSAEALLKKMRQEYELFWSEKRIQQAHNIGLSREEVVTVASIVEKESNKDDEKPVIAGVYLNRLKKGMLLQADPTVIFAWKDFTIRRVMKKHTELKSPYNTYVNTGLPPGPICLPSIASVDAVLGAANHGYIYFCAREDLSGYHNFAVTLDEHNRNARKYQSALNRKNIR
jgi:UPF0755 protein